MFKPGGKSPKVGQTLKGKWLLTAQLASGGQGETFRCKRRSDLEAQFVAKVFYPRGSSSIQRLKNEVNSLRRLQHKSIPKYVDSHVRFGGHKYLITEYIPGPTLHEVINPAQLKTLKLPDFPSSCLLVLNLLKCLEYCHRADIVHRDIKPGNIILRNGDFSEPVLIDFGLVFDNRKLEFNDQTKVDEQVGNRFLELPETRGLSPNKRDKRSDVTYVVGILFFLLSGRAPKVLQDEQKRAAHRRPESASVLQRLPEGYLKLVNTLFDKGFDYDINFRFQSVTDLRNYLEPRLYREMLAIERQQPSWALPLLLEWIRMNPALQNVPDFLARILTIEGKNQSVISTTIGWAQSNPSHLAVPSLWSKLLRANPKNHNLSTLANDWFSKYGPAVSSGNELVPTLIKQSPTEDKALELLSFYVEQRSKIPVSVLNDVLNRFTSERATLVAKAWLKEERAMSDKMPILGLLLRRHPEDMELVEAAKSALVTNASEPSSIALVSHILRAGVKDSGPFLREWFQAIAKQGNKSLDKLDHFARGNDPLICFFTEVSAEAEERVRTAVLAALLRSNAHMRDIQDLALNHLTHAKDQNCRVYDLLLIASLTAMPGNVDVRQITESWVEANSTRRNMDSILCTMLKRCSPREEVRSFCLDWIRKHPTHPSVGPVLRSVMSVLRREGLAPDKLEEVLGSEICSNNQAIVLSQLLSAEPPNPEILARSRIWLYDNIEPHLSDRKIKLVIDKLRHLDSRYMRTAAESGQK